MSLIDFTEDDLEWQELIGAGGFGLIYRGLLQRHHTVALKVVSAGVTHGLAGGIDREAMVLKQAFHPNIIRIYGMGQRSANGGEVCMVMELADLGSLRDLLVRRTQYVQQYQQQYQQQQQQQYQQQYGGGYGSRSGSAASIPYGGLGPRASVATLAQIAAGMAYLATRTPPISHLDLKAANILLVSRTPDAHSALPYVPKITDFGMAKLRQAGVSASASAGMGGGGRSGRNGGGAGGGGEEGVAGTLPFLPPEVFTSLGETAHGTSVYGVGRGISAYGAADPAIMAAVAAANAQTNLSPNGPVNPSPNANAGAGHALEARDVYAFALLAWETLSGGSPFSDARDAMEIMYRITHGTRPTFPPHTPCALAAVVAACWTVRPERRPRFAAVRDALFALMAQPPRVHPLHPSILRALPHVADVLPSLPALRAVRAVPPSALLDAAQAPAPLPLPPHIVAYFANMRTSVEEFLRYTERDCNQEFGALTPDLAARIGRCKEQLRALIPPTLSVEDYIAQVHAEMPPDDPNEFSFLVTSSIPTQAQMQNQTAQIQPAQNQPQNQAPQGYQGYQAPPQEQATPRNYPPQQGQYDRSPQNRSPQNRPPPIIGSPQQPPQPQQQQQYNQQQYNQQQYNQQQQYDQPIVNDPFPQYAPPPQQQQNQPDREPPGGYGQGPAKIENPRPFLGPKDQKAGPRPIFPAHGQMYASPKAPPAAMSPSPVAPKDLRNRPRSTSEGSTSSSSPSGSQQASPHTSQHGGAIVGTGSSGSSGGGSSYSVGDEHTGAGRRASVSLSSGSNPNVGQGFAPVPSPTANAGSRDRSSSSNSSSNTDRELQQEWQRCLQLYQKGEFEEALPLVRTCAIRGHPKAQVTLALMLFDEACLDGPAIRDRTGGSSASASGSGSGSGSAGGGAGIVGRTSSGGSGGLVGHSSGGSAATAKESMAWLQRAAEAGGADELESKDFNRTVDALVETALVSMGADRFRRAQLLLVLALLRDPTAAAAWVCLATVYTLRPRYILAPRTRPAEEGINLALQRCPYAAIQAARSLLQTLQASPQINTGPMHGGSTSPSSSSPPRTGASSGSAPGSGSGSGSGYSLASLYLMLVSAEFDMLVDRDAARAAEKKRQLTSMHFVPGQAALAECLFFGTGVPQDRAAAYHHFGKAARRDYPDAQYWVGACLARGEGTAHSPAEAVSWYQKAAFHGHVDAMFSVALCLERGDGCRQDAEEAAKWYRRACALGDTHSAANLARFYELGIGVDRDVTKALALYRRAADAGVEWAKAQLVRLSR